MPLSRYEFLRLSALGLPAAGLATGATARPAVMPVDLKITKVKPYVFKKATFVKIETDAGISGWGEADHDHPELVAKVIKEVCEKEVIGHSPFESEYLWMQMFFKGEDLGTTGLLPGTIAGIDNALWDLKGKLLGVPVHQLLGGNRVEKVRVYGSYGRSGGKNGPKNPAEMAATGAAFVELGYQTVKARMQIRQLNVDPDPDPTFEIIREVRKAIGDDVELFVDFNNGYTPAKAIHMGLRLYEHFNIAALEEPVSYLDYPGLSQVVEALPIPVMAGEHEFNKWQMRDLITVGRADVINADVIKCAGLTECKKVADLAHAFDRPVMVHNARPTLATAASLQLIGSIPNAARVQEYGGKREELNLNHLFDNYFTFQDGHLYVPQEPGLGLVVNEEAMEREKLN
jgi:L-alanine-DL-glutamate epimerase-like enolase superfamily enzyme